MEAMARLLFAVYAVVNMFRLIGILPGAFHAVTTGDSRDIVHTSGAIFLALPLIWFVVIRLKPQMGQYLLLRVVPGVLPIFSLAGGELLMPDSAFFVPLMLETLLVVGMLAVRPAPSRTSPSLIVLAFAAVFVGCVMIAPPPDVVFRVQSCLWRVGSDMKWHHPQGLSEDVTFDQALKEYVEKHHAWGKDVGENGLPDFMPKGTYFVERAGAWYSWEGRRVLCWHRVLTFKGYCYVLLLNDWKPKTVWHADVVESTSAPQG